MTSQTSQIVSRTQVSHEIAEQLLEELVSIPSPSHGEHSAVQFLVNWMQAHGYDDAYIDEAGNAVGIIGQGSQDVSRDMSQDVMLLGHIDTFGGFPDVRREGRLLYGRGTVDAKGPLCTFAAAAAQITPPPNTRFIVVGAVEEEASSSKGARHIAAQFNPSMCIIGEPSNWDRITLGYKGRLLIQWKWRGALAHSAGNVMSPPEHAFAYWQRVLAFVENYNRDKSGVFHTLDGTLQAINSGQDGAYGWSEMTIGFRLPPDCDPQEIAAQLQAEDAETTAYGMETAHTGDKNSTLSRYFRGAIRAQGGTPRFVYKTGTSDMNVVANHWNCEMLAYGPGDSALDHTPDEHIDLDEYLQAIAVLRDALWRL